MLINFAQRLVVEEDCKSELVGNSYVTFNFCVVPPNPPQMDRDIKCKHKHTVRTSLLFFVPP